MLVFYFVRVYMYGASKMVAKCEFFVTFCQKYLVNPQKSSTFVVCFV